MEPDLKKEIAKLDQLIAGLEKEIQLRSQLINQQKEMIEMLEEHISKITDIINSNVWLTYL